MGPSGPVLVIAGEPSGDRIAAEVVGELRRSAPSLRFAGAGGDASRAAGVAIDFHVDELAVTGVSEAVTRAAVVARLYAHVRRLCRRQSPQLALLVDYPGLNLRLARLLRRHGCAVLYCVGPQRWAWLGARVAAWRSAVDRLAVTLPFEEEWFVERGVSAVYVGHPSRDTFVPPPRAAARRALGIADDRELVALLPGSRESELRQHLPLIRSAARELSVAVAVATIPGAHEEMCAVRAPELPRAPADLLLGAADAALCACGTATIEAALAGVPLAAFYRLSRLSHAAARRLVTVRYAALPNLVLDRPVVPELLQGAACPSGLAAAARRLLEPREARRQQRAFGELRARLGPPGMARRTADLALDLLRAGAIRR